VLYWVAVVIVSLAIVIAVLLLLEGRDDSSLEGGSTGAPAVAQLSSSSS
jgi:hypothetical protein